MYVSVIGGARADLGDGTYSRADLGGGLFVRADLSDGLFFGSEAKIQFDLIFRS